jgi:hypothetical protein
LSSDKFGRIQYREDMRAKKGVFGAKKLQKAVQLFLRPLAQSAETTRLYSADFIICNSGRMDAYKN